MLGSLHPGNFSDGHNISHNEVILSVIVAAVVFFRTAYYLYVYVNFVFVLWSYLTSNFGTTKYFVFMNHKQYFQQHFSAHS
jgi:hypothetical protein